MERLTKRIGEHVYYTKLDYSKTIPSEYNPNDVGRILQALCAYEDTEHTPKECAAAFTELEAIKRNPPVQIESNALELAIECSKLKQELAAYRSAEQDGRLVVLSEPMLPMVYEEGGTDVYCPKCGESLSGGWEKSDVDDCRKLCQCFRCGQSIDDTMAVLKKEAEAALKEQEAQK